MCGHMPKTMPLGRDLYGAFGSIACSIQCSTRGSRGYIYGLTNAPRILWLNADEKSARRGGEVHGVDKCIWIFRNKQGHVLCVWWCWGTC